MSKPNGFIITDAGRALIAGWSAGQIESSLALAEIMVGSGTPPDGSTLESLYALTDLIAPIAPGTSTTPLYDGDTIHFEIEYRNDLNGGLTNGQWLSEYGIFVKHPTDLGKKILFGYGTLGDHPQYVSAYGVDSHDVRRFPVSITIGSGVAVTVLYDTAAFLTAKDLENYCKIIMVNVFMMGMEDLIKRHNHDRESHPDMRIVDNDHESRLKRLEDMYLSNITENPFMVTFDTLDGKIVTGVWNKTHQRIEF